MSDWRDICHAQLPRLYIGAFKFKAFLFPITAIDSISTCVCVSCNLGKSNIAIVKF